MPETDDKIKKIAKLLEKGGTMLATHHECGAPMFRYQSKVLCPVCDYQEEAKEIKIEPEITKKQVMKGIKPEITLRAEYSQIALLVKNKIQSIAATLENETDLQRVRDKMECIELGIKILRLIESSNHRPEQNP